MTNQTPPGSRIYCTESLGGSFSENNPTLMDSQAIERSEGILHKHRDYHPVNALNQKGHFAISNAGNAITFQCYSEKKDHGSVLLMARGHLDLCLILAPRTNKGLSKMIKDLKLPF